MHSEWGSYVPTLVRMLHAIYGSACVYTSMSAMQEQRKGLGDNEVFLVSKHCLLYKFGRHYMVSNFLRVS